MASRQQPREPVQRAGQVVPPRIRRRFPGMQRHPHPQRSGRIAPGFGQERALAASAARSASSAEAKAAWVPSPMVL